MSFIDIKDPKKRDAIVADYLATVKKIQHRHLNDRAQDLARQDDLLNIFKRQWNQLKNQLKSSPKN